MWYKNPCYLFLTALLLFAALNAASQNAGMVKGKVYDKKGPLEFVSILLYNKSDSSKPIRNTITDSSGSFILDRIAEGNYVLKIQLIGYFPQSKNISLVNPALLFDAGIINLINRAAQLQSVTVKAQKSIIQKTPQGFVVNADANLTQLGGTATDLLRNTPTVAVDAEGAITMRGKSPLILINGRNSSIINTDQIPASSIESIEIINNPSAQFDADAEAGIINIKLKKGKQRGTNGAMVIGAGLGAKGRINSSVLVNRKTDKWNIGLAYDNRFAGRTRAITGNRVNFDIPDSYFLLQNRSDERLEQLQNLRFNIDFSADNKNLWSFEAIGNLEGQDNDETLTSTVEKQSEQFNSKFSRRSLEIARSNVAEFAVNYNRKYNDVRKSLSATISTSLHFDRENTGITSQSLAENNTTIGDPFLQKTHNYENASTTNSKIDYVSPLSARAVIETGYKGIFRLLDADFETLDKINGSYSINPLASNLFQFNEQIHAAYIQYNAFIGDKNNPTWKYEAGIRAEQVWNNGKTGSNTFSFSNNYFNLFPTASIVYYKKQDEFWKASYSRRINRPGLGQLNPFTDITDSLNQHGGNPHLKPELVHSLETGYSKDWPKFSFYSILFYRYAANTIRQFTIVKPNGVALTQPVNIGSAATYGIENIVTAKPFSSYECNLSLSLFQQHINGSNLGKEVVHDVFSWYGKLINTIVLWKGSKVQVTGVYNSPLATPQGERIAIYNIDIGFQQKLGKGNARLGVIATDICNTQKNGFKMNAQNFISSRSSKADTRAILLTFAYTFGTSFKEKLMENTFTND